MPEGIVYILINEAMEGYVKIGKTTIDLRGRMRSLDNTSIPLPFTCFYAARVNDCDFVEARLHEAFADQRVRPNREFFRVSPERVKAALAIANGTDETPRADVVGAQEDDIVGAQEDERALNAARTRRANFSFALVDLPVGTILQSSFDPAITCTVYSNNRITFEDQVTSLSAAALVISQRQGYTWPTIAGPDYWLFEGKTLTELRREREATDQG